MTTATNRDNAGHSQPLEFFGFVVLMLLNIAVSRYLPGSAAATMVKIAYLTWVPVWLAFRIRAGYLRRKPHWTRASWLRYLRLAAMPVIAVSLMLYLSSFDTSSNVLGAPHSTTRAVVAAGLVAMMLLGVVGLIVAVDWLAKGDPAEQFMRTRWFQRRRAPG
jgi:hypothetical protein